LKGRRQKAKADRGGFVSAVCLCFLQSIADDNGHSQRNIADAVFESRGAQCRMKVEAELWAVHRLNSGHSRCNRIERFMRATSKRKFQNRTVAADLRRGQGDEPERNSVGVLLSEPRRIGAVSDELATSSGANLVSVDTYRGDYWQQSRRPLASLAFVAPLLLVYEAGILWLGPQAMRNGADVWLRQFLDLLGFSQYFLLPLLTVSLLAGWHHVTREPWRVSPKVLYAKLTECLVLAVTLVIIARVQANVQSLMTHQPPPAVLHASLGTGIASVCRRFVSFMGAGIYEELLFRLMLLPTVAALLRWLGCKPIWSVAGAAVLTGLIFAGAHHIGTLGEPFQWYAFGFRAIAGVFFAALFLCRGFGIAAGTHAAYDMLVGLI
jgi:Type II CAAX prenyl endopeptidase Rce1-like